MRIVGVTPGDPADRSVWSGSSAHLLDALRSHGVLADAVDGRPAVVDLLETLASFSPSRPRWRQRFSSRTSPLSPLARRAWSRRAARRLRRLGAEFDAVVQIGGWYDVGSRVARDVLLASYHDGNLGTYLRHPELVLDRGSPGVRRAHRFERQLYDRLDVIFTMSDWVRASFVEEFGQDERKVVTVHAGANFRMPPSAPPAREGSRPSVLFVGKGDFARKGGPQLLAAFERARAAVPSAELWLVGPERPLARSPGLVWLGRIPRTPEGEAELTRLYQEATVYAMPSLYEPFGIAFLEAMANGLPCVGGDSCAMPEIIEDGVTGYVVSPADVDALAERLVALLRDPSLARRLGEAGRQRFLERFTWDGVAGRMAGELTRRLPGP